MGNLPRKGRKRLAAIHHHGLVVNLAVVEEQAVPHPLQQIRLRPLGLAQPRLRKRLPDGLHRRQRRQEVAPGIQMHVIQQQIVAQQHVLGLLFKGRG